MAYRGDEGDALEAPTAEGPLRVELGPRMVRLSVGNRTLQLAGKYATVVSEGRKKPVTYELRGHVFVARGVPREDLGIWIEVPNAERGAGQPMEAVRRLFGVAPVSLFDPDGLRALKRLDAVAARLRTAVGALEHADDGGFSGRAVEIGSGEDLDKVLLADYGDHYAVYARRLFRDRARLQMAIHKDGKIVLGDAEPFKITSRFGITVRGDYVRFADPHGTDLARIAIPWIAPEDRDELARRIGQLVDRTA